MNCRCFVKLCHLLVTEGGLRGSWNIEVDEMVAIFLYTIAHNEKNRVLQVVFRRSGETISRVIHCVLFDVLKLHNILYRKPGPITENSTDPRWKYFKVSHHAMSRDYKTWTPELDAALIRAMLQLVENKEVESGNFQNGGFKKIESLMKTFILGCPMKVVPHIKSRHRLFKNKYIAITEVKNRGASGFGWDESKQQIVADKEVYQGWAKVATAVFIFFFCHILLDSYTQIYMFCFAEIPRVEGIEQEAFCTLRSAC
ncbi:hypothetical protein LINPERHAP2_LOCUS25047 [Linum perenne]